MRWLLTLVLGIGSVGSVCGAGLDHSVSMGLVYDSLDVKSADFDDSFTVSGTYSYYFASQWAFEATLSGINDSSSEWQFDNVGSYRITLNSLDFMLGARYVMNPSSKWKLFVQGGLLWYQMDIELDEVFYGLKPPGQVSTDDNGFGFTLGGGCGYSLRPNLDLSLALQYKSRKDVLGDSRRPFDVNTLGLLFEAEYKY